MFLDQRDNRALVRTLAKGRRTLNLFGYTGGFSVSAALGGAPEVWSVDQDEDATALARENFTLNGLSPDAHRFVSEDTSAYMKRAARENERFDLAIVDPPTVLRWRRGGQHRRTTLREFFAGTRSIVAHPDEYLELVVEGLRERVMEDDGDEP